MKEVEELNKAYFKSLANTRASASMMVISWTGVFILALEIFIFYYYFDTVAIINPFMNWFFDLLLISCFYLIVAFFIPLVGLFVYKKQILSTIFLLLVYMVIYFSLQLMMLLIIVTSISTKEFTIGFSLYSPIFIPFLLISTVCGFIYQYFWLKRQLKKGFSTNRTMGNYFTKSSAHNNNSLLIIFTVSMLGGLLSGKFAIVLGILTAVLFIYGFSQLITEVAYLLYLKTQSKEYWETEPDGEVSFRNLFRNLFKEFSLKKAKIRIPLEIFLLLLIIYIDGGNAYINVFINQTRWLLLLIRIFIISIGLDILGSFILYVIKKVNTRFKKGKKK